MRSIFTRTLLFNGRFAQEICIYGLAQKITIGRLTPSLGEWSFSTDNQTGKFELTRIPGNMK